MEGSHTRSIKNTDKNQTAEPTPKLVCEMDFEKSKLQSIALLCHLPDPDSRPTTNIPFVNSTVCAFLR